MKSKVLISCLILVIVGVSGYFLLSQKPVPIVTEQPVAQNLPNVEQTPTPPPATTDNISPQTPQSDTTVSTADWKTYTDHKNGFQIKYPKEFSISTVSIQDISGGGCEGDGCGDVVEWNIGNDEGQMNIQIDHDLKNYTFDFFADESGNYLKYENGKIVACDKKECTKESVTLDSNQVNTNGESIIKNGKNWKAFVLSDIYGSGIAKLYLIPNPNRNSMLEIRLEEKLAKNNSFESIIDTLTLSEISKQVALSGITSEKKAPPLFENSISSIPAGVTESWKIYNDSEFGFGFKYPPRFSYKVFAKEDQNIGYEYITFDNPEVDEGFSVSVINPSEIVDYQGNSGTISYIPNKRVCMYIDFFEYYLQDEKINNYSVCHFNQMGALTFSFDSFILIHPTKEIAVYITSYSNSVGISPLSLKDILSSFKFTN